MSVAVSHPWTIAAFLDWEERQPIKHEFDGVRLVGMAGVTAAHAFIQRKLAIAVGGRLRGMPCRFAGSDLKVEVAGSIRYPDGVVVCSPVPPGSTLVRDPVVVFEVLSDGTAQRDFVTKNQEYAATSSIRRYVALSQHRVGGTLFERMDDDWVGHLLAADAVLATPEIGIEVPLAKLYEGVDFAAEGGESETTRQS